MKLPQYIGNGLKGYVSGILALETEIPVASVQYIGDGLKG
jgi:hypothetical protein